MTSSLVTLMRARQRCMEWEWEGGGAGFVLYVVLIEPRRVPQRELSLNALRAVVWLLVPLVFFFSFCLNKRFKNKWNKKKRRLSR